MGLLRMIRGRRIREREAKVPEVPPPGALALPPEPLLDSLEAVEAHAVACLAAVGLPDWGFGWDRAVSRLGCCRMPRRLITLSRHFAEHFLERDPAMIRRVLLHELAHALCWVHAGRTGHGALWKAYCAALGIPGERATVRCEDFAQARPYRWVLCLSTTGEVIRYYRRRPYRLTPRRLASCYIPGRREETYGRLVLRQL